ncbi:MAG: T9SS type A sorting domain-containing protein, partial [Candidatus Latescibacteria bacterium]|nr:T9SS type A sorting domain-containing protein [Candidatus Latescibacterota bacterium]
NIGPDALPQLTVGMWVKLRSRANDQGWVFGHDDGGYDRSLNLHDARYSYGVAGGTGVDPHYSPLQLSLNEWHFVAAVYDRDHTTATFYADGAWQTVYANPGPGRPAATLGGLAQFVGHTVDGLVDEVVLYDRALTPQELDLLRSQITPPANQPPVANAGPAQTVISGQVVQLDGSQSSDPEHQPLSYHWHNFYSPLSSYTPPDWVPIALSGADTATPTFVAPAPGTYYFALVVDDGLLQSSATTAVTVMAANQPPVANAGPDQTVEGTGPLTSVTLNGAASTDPDGDALSYSWSENSAEISTASNPTLSLAQGPHTFTLTVSDGQGGSAVDEVVVNLVDTTAPTASAALVAISRGHDDDEDEDGNFYRVTATAVDLVDTNPTVSSLLAQPLTSGSSMSVSYKREKKNRIQVKMEKRKLQVKLEGPSEPALRALWTQVLANGGFSVSNGQEIQVEVKKDKKDEYEAQYQFDKTLKLTSAKGPGLKLVVWAADAAGNQSTRVEVAPGKSGRSNHRDDDHHAKLVGSLPTGFGLEANYPNPFNPSTTLRYNLAEAGQVQLTVYNVMGQQIRVLVDQMQQAGAYQIEWDSRDQAGQDVAPGLYLYRLVSGNQTALGKMLLVK